MVFLWVQEQSNHNPLFLIHLTAKTKWQNSLEYLEISLLNELIKNSPILPIRLCLMTQ